MMAQNKAIIYTINNCGYCTAAKNLLHKKGIEFIETNLTGRDDDIVELIKKTNHRTFPQIFITGQFIGGFNELKNLS